MAKVDREQKNFTGNRQHLESLIFAIEKSDIKIWNKIQNDTPNTEPDLSGVNLRGINLSRINFSKTNLFNADLSRSIFYRADLSGADLRDTNLCETKFRDVNFNDTILNGAQFNKTEFNLPFPAGIPVTVPSTVESVIVSFLTRLFISGAEMVSDALSAILAKGEFGAAVILKSAADVPPE